MRPAEPAELRAERLRVLLAAVGEEPALPPGEGVARGLPGLTRGDLALLDTVSLDDRALADACLALGRELRLHAYAAVETLMALVAEGAGDLETRVHALPQREWLRAAEAIMAAGWCYGAPGEADAD